MTYNAELFDRAASQYDENPPFFRILGEKLVEFAQLPSGAVVLDVGAGKGAVTLPALAAVGPSGRVTAVEVSPKMVEYLRGYSAPNLTVLGEDITRSTLSNGSQDHAISGFTIHILSDLQRALAQIHRVLRDDGLFSWSKPVAHPEAIEWENSYGQIFESFSQRLETTPTEMTEEADYMSIFRSEGFDLIDEVSIPISIPVGGPQEYWAWTQTHGARWLTDQLSPEEAVEFREAVIDSLRDLHPTRGRDIMVAPLFSKFRRR
jgi:ubiquinone/menaquinone biosynthesis C-methylase UbiE